MTADTTSHVATFHRCAVCKIDLKGRFVFIDDRFEKLLGHTKENLFGRSIMDFMADESKTLTIELLSQRNHYETFFDASEFTLINEKGESITMPAVVSLNFIAGNPVNFQIILDPRSPRHIAYEAPAAGRRPELSEVVSALLGMSGPGDLRPMLAALRGYVGAPIAVLYVIHDDVLELRCTDSADGLPEEAIHTLPEPSALHHRIARQGGEYAPSDEAAVRQAVEEGGEAPDEFIARLSLSPEHTYLLRVILDSDADESAVVPACGRARMIGSLAERLLVRPQEPAGGDEIDIQFTVGFLDHIGIGAGLTDGDGRLVGYNRSLNKLIATDKIGDTLDDLRQQLVAFNSPEDLTFLDFASQDGAYDTVQTINLPTGSLGQSRLIRLADDPRDLTSCLVIMRLGDAVPAAAADEFWAEIYRSVTASASRLYEDFEALTHRISRSLLHEEAEELANLTINVGGLRQCLDDLHCLAQPDTDPAETKVVDLQLLVRQVINRLRARFPKATAGWTYSGPEKVNADLALLRKVLQICLSNSLKFCRDNRCQIDCEASLDDGWLTMDIADDGLGVPRKYLGQVFDAGFQVPRRGNRRFTGSGTGLTVARQLLRRCGGDIGLARRDDGGARVTLRLPARAN